MVHFIPHPNNPTRTATVVTDQDGSKWGSANGDILSELFEGSSIYRRETPECVEVPRYGGETLKIGSGHNGERVIRTFVDAETAMQHAATIAGWSPESYTAQRGKGARHDYPSGRERNERLQRFLDRRHKPDRAAVKASTALFEQVDQSIDLDTLTPMMQSSVVGGSPNIGAYLTGSPNSMYRQVSPMTSEGTVRIFVDLSSSVGYTNEGIRGRGVALLALARCVQRLRPVELWVGTTGTAEQWQPDDRKVGGIEVGKRHMAHTAFMMRLSIAPFDITLASRMLADPFGGRGFCYYGELLSAGHEIGTSASLSFGPIGFEQTVGATENDIAFGPMYKGQKGAIGKNVSAVDWVRAELRAWLDRSGNHAAASLLDA